MVAAALELAKVPLRMDQPAAALQLYSQAMQQHPGDILPLLGAARVHDAMNESAQALQLYKQVCACVACHPLPAGLCYSCASRSSRAGSLLQQASAA